jgi:hypothetical protein
MVSKEHRLVISHIKIGFKQVVGAINFVDIHQPLSPFGDTWGRGILIRGVNYIDAVTGSYSSSHSRLKSEMTDEETTEGAFYFGYHAGTKTLYLEYASDRMFDFRDKGVLTAIMEALKAGNSPFKDFILEKAEPAP